MFVIRAFGRIKNACVHNRRGLALLLAAALALTGAVPAGAASTAEYKKQLQDLSSRYSELEKQLTSVQQDINRAKTEKDKQLAVKNQLDNQIYSTRQQITVLNERIDLLTGQIAELEDQIAEKQADMENQELRISDNQELLKRRLRVMYTTGNATVLGLLLGADSFSEFLTRAQVASRVAEHDQDLIRDMTRELAEIRDIKESIEETKLEVEENMKDVEDSRVLLGDKQASLGTQLSQTQDAIEDIAALEKEYLANKAALEKQQKEVQAEIDSVYAQIQSIGKYEGGVMLWPLEGYYTVTSDFGWRFGGTDFHTGIDISGQSVYGKPIRAAAAGRVAFVQTKYVANRGYGIYLIIDHGSNISTLYGHTSGIAVKVGQQVKRGQTIAYVGSTGWSTGPHLHFEVRENGKYVTPWKYLGSK
jgi:murein DD-endopeptidase MepM/ murein hydrolase activator NlpD